ncbi:alpha/beta hydrolase [Pirellulaceae bacterium SH449]
MRSESVSLFFSLIALLCIPCAIVIALAAIRRLRNKSAMPFKGVWGTCAMAATITVVITLVISFILKATGFFDQQFYRPSARSFGAQDELRLQPEIVSFASADGTMLHGWFLRSEDDPLGTVICFQGSDRNITYTTRSVYWLTQRGFNVFVFDYRGYGLSEGAPDRKGLVEDSVAAIDYVVTRSDVRPDRIVLYGQSMGGQLALNAASIRKDAGIRLVIAEATYARQSYHLSDKLGQIGPLWLVKWGGWLLTSDEYSGESAIADLRSTPVLLVHGNSDTGVIPYHSERLFDAAAGAKEIWRYEGIGHLQIFNDEPPRERLVEFIKTHLSPMFDVDGTAAGGEQTDEREPE